VTRHPPSLRARAHKAAAWAATIVAIATWACHRTEPPVTTRTVHLTTGTPGARFHPLGRVLARALTSTELGITVIPQDSDGSVSNVEALEDRRADIGLAYADVAYLASVGQLHEGRQPAAGLRGIAVLEFATVHLVVRHLSARSVDAALLRGKRIAVGPAGSGSAITAGLVLRALGLNTPDTHVISMRYDDAARRLAAGEIDAMFVTGADPLESVRASTRAGARLASLDGPAIDTLRLEYPFFRRAMVPGNTYPGHPDPVSTIGVDNLLVCRYALDETLVHDLTARLFDQLPWFPDLAGLDPEQAPSTPIPLHPGAARYYRERELRR